MNVVKLQGMGNEKYIRRCGICRNDNEYCNWCDYYPADMSKHKHKFFLKSNILITSFWKRLIRQEYRQITYKCLCKESKQFQAATTCLDPSEVLQ